MKISEQVCSLELAKKLKSFGVEQVSLFYWRHFGGWKVVIDDAYPIKSLTKEESYSAFTVPELCQILPTIFGSSILHILKGINLGDPCPTYFAHYPTEDILSVAKDKMADAVAFLLIAILEDRALNARSKYLIVR